MSGANRVFDSYEDMYISQYNEVYRYVRRMIRNNESAVEDVTQEVFFVAYEKWENLQIHPNIPGFLMVVAQNKIKKWFEKQSRCFADEEEVLDYVSKAIDKEHGIDVYKMVDFYSSVEHTLSEHDLDILRHYYEYGYTSTEMAKKLGITESCFKVRVARMKAKIKNSIKLFSFLAATLAYWEWM